ncbi:MAG: apolipoprotein N-acyltransferase [Gammaproteobacteria bacterium]|nr:apolipoprotein N-acyltransferase [Gammaproteobacteria bacterium]
MPSRANFVTALVMAGAGGLLVCAFAPFFAWWLTFLCPLALYVFIQNLPRRDAFVLGYIFGLFFFGFGVSWTYNSIHEFGHAPVLLSALLVGLLVLTLSLFPALTAALYSMCCRERTFDVTGAVAFSTLWVLLEWVRGWIFTGFPWLLIGHAHHSSLLSNILPVFGSLGASWLTLVISSLAAVLVAGAARQRFISAAFVVLVAAGLYIAGQVTWTHPQQESLNVALIQGNIPQEMKWNREQQRHILGKYWRLSKDNQDADIIIWPETAIPAYYDSVKDSYIVELEKISRAGDVDFLIGLFTQDSDSGEIYNSVMTLGSERSVYSKRHLVPFGEYIPLRSIASFLADYIVLPMADMSSGTGRPLVRLKGHYAGASICYEAVYGNEVIDALPEAKFLINVSNDAWFGDSFAPHQHLEIARSRAIETGRYLLRATSTGISAVIDPGGVIVERSNQFREEVVRATIRPYTGLTPYAYWGDSAIIAILSGIFLIIGLHRRSLLRSEKR